MSQYGYGGNRAWPEEQPAGSGAGRTPGYTQQPTQGYTSQGTGYTGQQTGYPGQGTGYTGQQPGYATRGPGYTNQMPPSASGPMAPVPPEGGFNYRPNGDTVRDEGLKRWQKILIVAALLAAAVYAVVALVPDRSIYGVIRVSSLGEHHTGDALVVRSEVPYDAEGVTNIRYRIDEGSSVSRSTAICDVYSAGYSTKEMTALQDYRDQIRDYQKKLLEEETTYDARMARAESDVLTRMKEVRAIMAGRPGNLTTQESLLNAAISSRQQYLKQKYSADQRLSRLYDDEQAQLQKIESWTKTYSSQMENVFFSSYSDGYEYGLTTENFESFKPQEVRAMFNGEKPRDRTVPKGRSVIYRLVSDTAWNVLMLCGDTSWNPVSGKTYNMRLDNQVEFRATVLSFEHTGGELLIRLGIPDGVRSVLSKRASRVELYDEESALVVPSRAIYRQDGMQGIVVVDGNTQSFIPVTVIRQEGNDYFINPINQGLLFEGMVIRLF